MDSRRAAPCPVSVVTTGDNRVPGDPQEFRSSSPKFGSWYRAAPIHAGQIRGDQGNGQVAQPGPPCRARTGIYAGARPFRLLPAHFRPSAPPLTSHRRRRARHRPAPPPPGPRLRLAMAEVGRAAVCDPNALLPGGFWAAVAVWLERPQVANKRLCGVLLEARRRAALPCAEARDPRPSAGAAQAPAARGPEEFPGRLQQEGDQKAAAGAPLLAGASGQPGKAGVGEGDLPSSGLDSLWDDFFRSLAGDGRELLAFLTGSRAGSQPEAQHELDMVLRTIIPKKSLHCPLTAPRREIVVQGKSISESGRCQRYTAPAAKVVNVDFN